MGSRTQTIVQHGNVYGPTRGDGVRSRYKGETKMIKWILILMVLLGLLMYGLIVATATPNDREEYERYMEWKERKRNGKAD